MDKNNITHGMQKSKMVQRDQILEYLNTHEGASVRDLMVKLNINSPTKRISELVAMGYPIRKYWVKNTNRHGETKRFIRYQIRKEQG